MELYEINKLRKAKEETRKHKFDPNKKISVESCIAIERLIDRTLKDEEGAKK